MRSDRATGLPGVLATVLLAAGCAGTPARDPRADGGIPPVPTTPATVEPVPASNYLRGPIAELALSMVGVQYRYGGADPREGFDCSGLVYYAFTSNGHDVPRTSREQFNAAQKIPLAEAAEGDLVFFQDQEKLSHVGIYLGDGQFVHAPSSGGTVSVANIDAPYYQRHLIGVGRLLP
jgi:cell wall-associated NlpC family hydrolase